jgi:hypothetical protein
VPRVARDDAPPCADGPAVTVIVPARNEAERLLEPCLRSILASDWPRLSIIVVDDRSTDATPAILAALAASEPRLTVVRGGEPPPGWLGKPHAMHLGTAAATSEWLLATDADMIHDAQAVRRALDTAARYGADMVSFIPSCTSASRGVAEVMPIAVWLIMFCFPPSVTSNPRDPRALASGGFMLVRRDALAAAGGYAALAGDVAEDVDLARRVKATGRRVICAMAPELVTTPMYGSLSELFAGFSKNALRAVDHSVPRAVAGATSLLAVGVAPAVMTVAALVTGHAHLAWTAGAAWLAEGWCFAYGHREYGNPGWHAVSAPLGFLVMAGVTLNGAWHAVRGRGIDWRGRGVPQSGGAAGKPADT